MSERKIGGNGNVGPRRTRALALACAVVFAVSPVARALQDDDGDTFAPLLFQLYDTQGARARAAQAQEHIGAGRWSEALASLQALIEDHRGEVLGASRPHPIDARTASQQPVHPGAGSWAVLQLFALPDDARTLYQERFGRRAEAALDRAIGTADRGALARVARRWPLTSAAERAWWALGDLEVELGHAGDGLRSWARAAALRVGDPLRVTTTAEHWLVLRDELDSARASASDSASASASASASERSPGAVARATLALKLLPEIVDGNGSTPVGEATFSRGPASGIAATSITSSRFAQEGAAGWPRPFRLPHTPYSEGGNAGRLFPQRAGDVVIVNTSRSVHALDAFDGSELWSLEPEQLNWGSISSRESGDYDTAVDTAERIVTVATSRGVVIAPVQIPWSFEDRDQYNDLSIIEVIPERRLVALDLATGKMLWHTFPPYDWDGDTGSFAERMTVVGPPTIVGARVLVPMARLRGRIEMHLGCFDLTTGDVLWSAPLVTGQRTLNMFGRADVEFSAPPPVVAGDTVIVATQLGLVASIDLFTGETRWDALYEQVPIQPPQYYAAGWMLNKWRNAPPIVVGDTIVVAPFDGKELFALDAATGATLWSIKPRMLTSVTGIDSGFTSRGRVGGLNVLLGADEQRLLLGGTSVASIEFSNGLRAGPPFGKAWSWPAERLLRRDGGFPTVDAESVFIPYGGGVMIIDRENGRVREDLTGRIGGGHLLVADGMLFSTDGSSIDARFEWTAMVERARAALRRTEATAADLDMLVRLLLERSEALLNRGTDVARALGLTTEALRALTEFVPDASVVGATREDDAPRRRSQKHRAFMLRVRAERIRGDADAARLAARTALKLESGSRNELESLLALHEIERTRDVAMRAEILDELLAHHADTTIEVEARVVGGRWSPAVALSVVLESTRRSGASGSRLVRESMWSDPWSGPITPTLVALGGRRASEQDSFERRTSSISVGLFALLSQVEIARVIGDPTPAVAGELLALHAVLRETPNEKLFGAISGEWATARIRAIRVLSASSPAIASFDRAAELLFERARRTAELDGSTDELDSVRTLFPGSPAEQSAAEARIEFALASGSPHKVAEIVVEAIDRNWHPARSTERETALLLQLAAALGDAGNTELRAGIAANLARYRPEAVVKLPELGNVTLSELARRWTTEGRPLRSPRATFNNDVVTQHSTAGEFVPVGRGPLVTDASGERDEVLILQSRSVQVALVSGASGQPLWSRASVLGGKPWDRRRRVHLGVDSIIVGERLRVVCVDSLSGADRWSFSRKGRTIESVAVSGGVAVVVTTRTDTQEVAEVHGIDAVLGIELWRLPAIGRSYQANIKVGDGRFVLLPAIGTRAAVHDLYTGHPVAGIATGRLSQKDSQATWVDRGRLVTAFIHGGKSPQARNEIVAYELDDGELAWSIDLDNHAGSIQDLTGIIEMPSGADGRGTVRLAMLERIDDPLAARGLGRREVGLYVLNERLGALSRTPLVTLSSRTYLAGINSQPLIVVTEPLLIAVEAGQNGDSALISAIDPRIGEIWKAHSARRIRASGMEYLAQPVVGDGVVAMVVRESFGRPGSAAAEMKLMFVDSVSGKHVETRPLESGTSSARWRNLAAVGGTLVAMGAKQMTVME